MFWPGPYFFRRQALLYTPSSWPPVFTCLSCFMKNDISSVSSAASIRHINPMSVVGYPDGHRSGQHNDGELVAGDCVWMARSYCGAYLVGGGDCPQKANIAFCCRDHFDSHYNLLDWKPEICMGGIGDSFVVVRRWHCRAPSSSRPGLGFAGASCRGIRLVGNHSDG